MEKETSPNTQYQYDGKGKSTVWAILVEPVCNTTETNAGTFRLVGLALIGNEKWMGKAKCQDTVLASKASEDKNEQPEDS